MATTLIFVSFYHFIEYMCLPSLLNLVEIHSHNTFLDSMWMNFAQGHHAVADAVWSADAKYISFCIFTSQAHSILTPFEGKTPSYLFLKPFPFFKSQEAVFSAFARIRTWCFSHSGQKGLQQALRRPMCINSNICWGISRTLFA